MLWNYEVDNRHAVCWKQWNLNKYSSVFTNTCLPTYKSIAIMATLTDKPSRQYRIANVTGCIIRVLCRTAVRSYCFSCLWDWGSEGSAQLSAGALVPTRPSALLRASKKFHMTGEYIRVSEVMSICSGVCPGPHRIKVSRSCWNLLSWINQ